MRHLEQRISKIRKRRKNPGAIQEPCGAGSVGRIERERRSLSSAQYDVALGRVAPPAVRSARTSFLTTHERFFYNRIVWTVPKDNRWHKGTWTSASAQNNSAAARMRP